MRFLILLFTAFFLNACAPIHVNYDFDKAVNFNNYKTYNYYADMETGLSELDTRRFLEALDAKLKAKGLVLADTPDFFIDIKSREYQEVAHNNVGVGLGGSGRNMGGGLSIGIPVGQSKVNRRITIDFVDHSKNQLFWQAVSDYGFNPNAQPEQREAKFSAVAEKILSKYPPKP
ncbi:DUF4136 domain-containing protein [Mariniflexile ostreae]|uniref:DUF4136 domain-containing protein n=1 Tax=Mariniflexile ostreae TaxID=1520892 RepID=A0ABV5FCS9_9FLAO